MFKDARNTSGNPGISNESQINVGGGLCIGCVHVVGSAIVTYALDVDHYTILRSRKLVWQ